MELVATQYEVQRIGSETIVLEAGDTLKIETLLAGGGGAEILEYVVPTDRSDNIQIKIVLDEVVEEAP